MNPVSTTPPPSDPASPAERVRFEVETRIPTVHGTFRVRAYTDTRTGALHLAFIAESLPTRGAASPAHSHTSAHPHASTPVASRADDDSHAPPLARIHSECLTGETFGSLKCECGPQLDAALAAMQAEATRGGSGVLLYLRGHEGRGIGLLAKLHAYRLQEDGVDTVDANTRLGFQPDEREYGAATAILTELGVPAVRLLTNNPLKADALTAAGIRIAERVPLEVGAVDANRDYLRVKAARMGHLFSDAFLGEQPPAQ